MAGRLPFRDAYRYTAPKPHGQTGNGAMRYERQRYMNGALGKPDRAPVSSAKRA